MQSRPWFAALLLGALMGMPAVAGAQAGEPLGTVRLPRSVMANGEVLAAGSYTVRLSNDPVTRVVGQSPETFRWVEFLANGQPRGRELATVVPPADVKEVAKGTPPPEGTPRVQTLRGGDYLRVWFNRGGTQYLIHFNIAK